MRRTPLLGALIAIALLLTSCGDDDTDTATEDTVAEPTETETVTETETESEDAGDIDEDALAGELGECGFLAGFATAFEDFDPSTIYGGGEATDFGQLFGPLADAASEVADAAPEEIRDAFRTMADGFTAVAEELDGVVIDFSDPAAMDPEAMEKLESLGTAFQGDFEAASTEIETWVTANCSEFADRFDLDSFGS